jgi:hypothetical protein
LKPYDVIKRKDGLLVSSYRPVSYKGHDIFVVRVGKECNAFAHDHRTDKYVYSGWYRTSNPNEAVRRVKSLIDTKGMSWSKYKTQRTHRRKSFLYR